MVFIVKRGGRGKLIRLFAGGLFFSERHGLLFLVIDYKLNQDYFKKTDKKKPAPTSKIVGVAPSAIPLPFLIAGVGSRLA